MTPEERRTQLDGGGLRSRIEEKPLQKKRRSNKPLCWQSEMQALGLRSNLINESVQIMVQELREARNDS